MDTPEEILKKIRGLEIKTRALVETAFAGDYHSVFKGRGMNFEDVREYQPGDEIRAIDWNVTARLGSPFVKKFTEERELTVMLIVDVSASGNFGSTSQSKRELAAEVACLLAFSAIRNNDKVGLLLFSDRLELFIAPKKGRSHTLRIIREILFFDPIGRGTDSAAALDHLNRIITRRAVVFLISDFQAPDFSRELAVTAKRVRAQFAQLAQSQLAETMRVLRRNRIDRIELRTGDDYLPALRSFFKQRERRLMVR
jgi:uncharacterized protein (DUF58 family)